MKGIRRLFALAGLVGLGACAINGTRLVQTWTNPELDKKPIRFSKAIVLAIAPSETERRNAEDAMVSDIGNKAVASYKELGAQDLKNIAQVKSLIQASGADGVVLLRWLGVREEKEVYSTPLYSPLWDHYSYSWTYWQEEDVVNWRVLRLETRIYAVADEKLIWSGATETVEPPGVPKLIKELAPVLRKELTKQGLLLPPSPEGK